MIMLFNLSIVYAISLSQKSFLTVDIMFVLFVVQFALIIVYHMIAYTIGENFKTKMQLYINTLINPKPCLLFKMFGKWIIKRCDKRSPNSNTEFHSHDISFCSNIPDKTYDYSKYQEPLLGED